MPYAEPKEAPYIKQDPRWGPVVIHERLCETCDGTGEVNYYGGYIYCDDRGCSNGLVRDDECECGTCSRLWEEAGAACGCGKCGACEVLASRMLGPITLAQHEAIEDAKAEYLRELEQERQSRAAAVSL